MPSSLTTFCACVRLGKAPFAGLRIPCDLCEKEVNPDCQEGRTSHETAEHSVANATMQQEHSRNTNSNRHYPNRGGSNSKCPSHQSSTSSQKSQAAASLAASTVVLVLPGGRHDDPDD